MRLNSNIITEALGLPAVPWTPEARTDRNITHAELLQPGTNMRANQETLWLMDLDAFRSLEVEELPRDYLVVSPVAVEPGEVDETRLLVDVGGLPSAMNRVSRIFARYDDWSHKLSRASVHPRAISTIIELTQEMMGCPIVLFALDCTILGTSSMSFNHDSILWRSIDELGFMPMDVQMQDNMSLFFVHDSAHGRITQGIWHCDPNYCYLDAAVMYQGEPYAWLSAVGSLEGFSVGEASVFRHVRHRIEEALIVQGGDKQESIQVVGLIRDLLNGKDIPQKTIAIKAGTWANTEEDSFLVFMFVLDQDVDDPLVRIPMLRSNLRSIFATSIVLERDSNVMMVMKKPKSEKGLVGAIRDVKRVSHRMRCHCIMAPELKSLVDIHECYRQMEQVEHFVGLDTYPPLTTFEDLFDQYLLSELLATRTFDQVGHPCVVKLEERNDSYGIDLITCLMTYLENDRSTAITSKILYTHRNTIHYRIGKIEEALGRKIEELSPAERLHLLLSCKMALREIRK